jgi:type VI protein secretion system component VasF
MRRRARNGYARAFAALAQAREDRRRARMFGSAVGLVLWGALALLVVFWPWVAGWLAAKGVHV